LLADAVNQERGEANLYAYIVRRLLTALVVLIIVTIVIFVVMRMLPGDPILLFLSQDVVTAFTADEIAAARHEYGLDKPIMVQYLNWISGVLHGDLGVSIFRRSKVTEEIATALPVTLYIGLLAWIISHAIAVPAGIICAIKRGKWIDTVITVLANIGITAPQFWVGISELAANLRIYFTL
jgi:peptide/nickel transport system permease protein